MIECIFRRLIWDHSPQHFPLYFLSLIYFAFAVYDTIFKACSPVSSPISASCYCDRNPGNWVEKQFTLMHSTSVRAFVKVKTEQHGASSGEVVSLPGKVRCVLWMKAIRYFMRSSGNCVFGNRILPQRTLEQLQRRKCDISEHLWQQ